MQGWNFLIVGKKGPINHGVIAERITAEKYLCEFARYPKSWRICSLEEMQGWTLFPNDGLMNAFILTLTKKIPPPPTKKKKKKKVAKKTPRRKSNVKT